MEGIVAETRRTKELGAICPAAKVGWTGSVIIDGKREHFFA